MAPHPATTDALQGRAALQERLRAATAEVPQTAITEIRQATAEAVHRHHRRLRQDLASARRAHLQGQATARPPHQDQAIAEAAAATAAAATAAAAVAEPAEAAAVQEDKTRKADLYI